MSSRFTHHTTVTTYMHSTHQDRRVLVYGFTPYSPRVPLPESPGCVHVHSPHARGRAHTHECAAVCTHNRSPQSPISQRVRRRTRNVREIEPHAATDCQWFDNSRDVFLYGAVRRHTMLPHVVLSSDGWGFVDRACSQMASRVGAWREEASLLSPLTSVASGSATAASDDVEPLVCRWQPCIH